MGKSFTEDEFQTKNGGVYAMFKSKKKALLGEGRKALNIHGS